MRPNDLRWCAALVLVAVSIAAAQENLARPVDTSVTRKHGSGVVTNHGKR